MPGLAPRYSATPDNGADFASVLVISQTRSIPVCSGSWNWRRSSLGRDSTRSGKQRRDRREAHLCRFSITVRRSFRQHLLSLSLRRGPCRFEDLWSLRSHLVSACRVREYSQSRQPPHIWQFRALCHALESKRVWLTDTCHRWRRQSRPLPNLVRYPAGTSDWLHTWHQRTISRLSWTSRSSRIYEKLVS